MIKLLITWLLPTIIDTLINSLKILSVKSDNTIDDKLIEIISENRDSIINEIKEEL